MPTNSVDFKATAVAREEFLESHPDPVIFHFQPREFAVLEEPEDLRTWEALLTERVGVSADVGRAIVDAIRSNGGTCCESGSTDDCDQD